jgi:hypothetical protein
MSDGVAAVVAEVVVGIVFGIALDSTESMRTAVTLSAFRFPTQKNNTKVTCGVAR